MKKMIKNIINYLWRWSNTKLTSDGVMLCTFCGASGMWTMTSRGKEHHYICDKCYPYYKIKGLKSSYWGGLGHR